MVGALSTATVLGETVQEELEGAPTHVNVTVLLYPFKPARLRV
jgi:hypothetical protein